VKTREVKPNQASEYPGSSVSKELMRVPGGRHVASTSSAVPSKSSSNGRLCVTGSSRRNGTIDTGSEPLEISSNTVFELTTSDYSKINVVRQFRIKIDGTSKH